MVLTRDKSIYGQSVGESVGDVVVVRVDDIATVLDEKGVTSVVDEESELSVEEVQAQDQLEVVVAKSVQDVVVSRNPSVLDVAMADEVEVEPVTVSMVEVVVISVSGVVDMDVVSTGEDVVKTSVVVVLVVSTVEVVELMSVVELELIQSSQMLAPG